MKLLVLVLSTLLSALAGVAAEEKPLNVAVGEELKIVLESNHSSGNQWLMAKPLDQSLLKLLGSEYKRGRPGAAGGTGSETLTFKALGGGKTRIYLKYARLWERDAAPASTTNFLVVISKSGSGSR